MLAQALILRINCGKLWKKHTLRKGGVLRRIWTSLD
jgi:hypothetical protein